MLKTKEASNENKKIALNLREKYSMDKIERGKRRKSKRNKMGFE
jgi:hypothetical protein